MITAHPPHSRSSCLPLHMRFATKRTTSHHLELIHIPPQLYWDIKWTTNQSTKKGGGASTEFDAASKHRKMNWTSEDRLAFLQTFLGLLDQFHRGTGPRQEAIQQKVREKNPEMGELAEWALTYNNETVFPVKPSDWGKKVWRGGYHCKIRSTKSSHLSDLFSSL